MTGLYYKTSIAAVITQERFGEAIAAIATQLKRYPKREMCFPDVGFVARLNSMINFIMAQVTNVDGFMLANNDQQAKT